ncbi:iron export ABC transporter permease subunit FetB [Serpentinicella sp. ANB-PHB4]|uniref:ABC transporter permease n=1 Tax=Serpentinicella sp. ANB-PHB4 TaxID=3074076 RepID=UPI00285D4BEF|nr:iron export ABC transporter permease subunit FetB [Serpentinicella sp. ANB-PHB4]MDR5659684.1 iron export ABC transporter permease subunit FetB [Serpentinicella sp. ANB-PHB4]
MDSIIELQIWQVAAAYIFVALLLAIVKIKKINREREILLSTVRMTLQLILTGYVLVYLFENPHPLLTIAVLMLMQVFAVKNIYKRVKHDMTKKLKHVIGFSMIIGTLVSLVYFVLIVINLSPWYEPRYFIPLGGMIIGNAMTGIALGTNQLIDGMQSKKHLVEAALMLGATPKDASKTIVNNAFDSAILPTINSMLGMGIVFLPGMMTGQILSGVSPLTAIEYQIAIMLGILGSVSLSVILFVQLGYKTFFNDEYQLNE